MKIDVLLNETEFIKFGGFDALYHRKIWRSPVIFAAAMSICATICLFTSQVRGATALGIVLLTVGLGVPAAYFLNFYLSLRKQALKDGLAENRYIYTIELRDQNDGIIIDNGHEHAIYSWEQVFHVYRNTACTYLYITPQRAFLIPHACVKGEVDRLWELISHEIPETRYTVLK